jgi:hypothetical protein
MCGPTYQYTLAASVFGENIPKAQFASWYKKENSQIFNEDFYLLLYLPL